MGLIGWVPGITQNSLQFMVFDYGSLLLFGISIMNKPQREFENYNIFLILAACILTALINNYKAYPVNLVHVVSGCLIYFSVVRSLKDYVGIIKLLAFICFLNLAMACTQKLGFNPLYTVFTENPSIQRDHFSMPGFMARNYHLSYLLMVTVPLVFFAKERFKTASVILLAFSALVFIVLTKSYAILLGFAVMALYYLHIKKNYFAIWILTMMLATGVIFNHKTILGKLSVRSEAYQYILKESFINPFVGNGLGSFEMNTGAGSDKPLLASSFNQYLKLGYELGIVGFGVIIHGLWKYYRRFKYFMEPHFIIALLGAFTYPMFHEVMRFARLDIILLTLIAMFEINCINRREYVNGRNNKSQV